MGSRERTGLALRAVSARIISILLLFLVKHVINGFNTLTSSKIQSSGTRVSHQ